jgi:hypothetical protein
MFQSIDFLSTSKLYEDGIDEKLGLQELFFVNRAVE